MCKGEFLEEIRRLVWKSQAQEKIKYCSRVLIKALRAMDDSSEIQVNTCMLMLVAILNIHVGIDKVKEETINELEKELSGIVHGFLEKVEKEISDESGAGTNESETNESGAETNESGTENL